MRGFNKVILMGNVTRDPQLKYLPNETAVAEIGLAMNRKWRDASGQDKEEVCFVDCVCFGKQAETLNQYATKGKPLMVEGRLKFDTWEDKQGGKRSKLSVVVETFTLLGSRDGGGDQEDRQEAPAPSRRPQTMAQGIRDKRDNRPAPQEPWNPEQQFKEDDIPF